MSKGIWETAPNSPPIAQFLVEIEFQKIDDKFNDCPLCERFYCFIITLNAQIMVKFVVDPGCCCIPFAILKDWFSKCCLCKETLKLYSPIVPLFYRLRLSIFQLLFIPLQMEVSWYRDRVHDWRVRDDKQCWESCRSRCPWRTCRRSEDWERHSWRRTTLTTEI